MKTERNKALTLFALTLLVTSLFLVNMNGFTSAQQPEEPIYLHGPSLVPIHMHGPSLVPIHMHSKIGIIDTSYPIGTPWHALHPPSYYCQNWTLTSWEDNGNEYLDSSDQIDMTNDLTAEVRWYHVDRVTMTLGVYSEYFQEFIYVEYKGSYEPYIQPVSTNWTEVWPVYGGVTGGPYHIIDWMDQGSGLLDFCDFVMFEDWPGIWWHVEEYATDLILNEKIMDPQGIWWHELYPSYCNWHNLTSWEEPIEDPYPGRLSPGDQIDMYNETSGITKWYFVDRVTLTLDVTIIGEPHQNYFFEYKGPFETIYEVKIDPVCTYWHMVWPDYSPEYTPEGGFHIEYWEDNCNGVLDYCDNVTISGELCHVEGLAIDIILNEKIENPTYTYWHELHPQCCVNDYYVEGWEDNGDKLLSPCDNVTMSVTPTGLTDKYHVENVTLTLNLTILDYEGIKPEGDRIYIELLEYYELMYYAKINPWDTDWEIVCPDEYWFGYPLTIVDWEDDCNGVLSYCDNITLVGPESLFWCHVDDVAVDMTVKKITVELVHDVAVIDVYSIYDWVYQGEIDPIKVTITNEGDFDEPEVNVTAYYNGNPAAPMQTTSLNIGETKILTFDWDTTGVPPGSYQVSATAVIPVDDDPGDNSRLGNWEDVVEVPTEPWYTKPPYPDYAPSGMPDFDQKQDVWGPSPGTFTWCGPVAAANSLWWLDSKFEPNTIPPPAIIDNFPLVQAYGAWDDHDQLNVDPLVRNLAALMNTDGIVPGTYWWDLEAGINQYLVQQGVEDLFEVHSMEFPEFEWIEYEIYLCEDVVLFLEFWYLDGQTWYPFYEYPFLEFETGHYVTCAGVNSSTFELLISDPWQDAYELQLVPGRSPAPHAPHPGDPTVHNDAQYVSHDAYQVAPWDPSPYGPGWPMWELVGYADTIWGPGPTPIHAFIRAAVVTSPISVDVEIIDKVPWTIYCSGPVSEGYPDWTVNINVTVLNNGTSPATFTVSAYANETLIGTQPVNDLPAGQNTTLTFNWSLTGVPLGLYNLEVYAGDDNIDGTFLVKLDGDVNGGRVVESTDLVFGLGPAMGSRPGDENWNCQADFNFSGVVESTDLVFGFAPNNGQSY
jgi:hypothetical protein